MYGTVSDLLRQGCRRKLKSWNGAYFQVVEICVCRYFGVKDFVLDLFVLQVAGGCIMCGNMRN